MDDPVDDELAAEIDALMELLGREVDLSGTKGRARVDDLLPEHPDQALMEARAIRDPWFRCQSLAMVAGHIPEPDRTVVLDEAFAAADEMAEPNRIVSVASWPLEVLVMDGGVERAATELERLGAIIEGEPQPIRRMDGWSALYFAVETVPSLRERASPLFLRSVVRTHGWKRDRALRWLAGDREAVDPGSAPALISLMESPRMRRRTRRALGLDPERSD